jgi:hypothetical protein
MSKAAMGAQVLYCGHNGGFVADIFDFGEWNAVKANGPVTPSNIERKNFVPTHHISDFPISGCWAPERGMFFVPSSQVKELKPKYPRHSKSQRV